MKTIAINTIFGRNRNILIGMIHLPSLLSAPNSLGMAAIIRRATDDLTALEQAGFDGALIENDNDKPHTEFANETQIANMTTVAQAICQQAKIPIGVQVMLNDWRASIAIAKVTGAQFTRLDVFVDHVTSEWGEINPIPSQIAAYKERLNPELLLLTDIQVKYKTMVTPRPLVHSAALAIENSSNGLVITGNATGEETPLAKILEVRDAFPEFPLFVGAGIDENNIHQQLSIANGAIIGTSIKKDGQIDVRKAHRLRKLA